MKWIAILLCMLVACVPVSEPNVAPTPALEKQIVKPTLPPVVPLKTEPATRTVKQEGTLGTFVYGLTEDNRVVRIEKTGATWEYHYDNGKLTEITGPEDIVFSYNQGTLSDIKKGPLNVHLTYDARNRLIEAKGYKETLYAEYDTENHLRGVKRGVAGQTGIDYDKKGLVKYLTRGQITTNVFFDDKSRVRNFDADDTKFIIGYWRDSKVISLTGITFGQGLTVSYGPDYPPLEAKIIYENKDAADNSVFTAAYTDTLYTIVDQYTYCKYIRRLKDVFFEGTSYVFYSNYFKGDLAGYLQMQFACIPYEA